MMGKIEDKPDGEREVFTVEKGVLRANADLYWEYLEEFALACDKLLSSRRGTLEVDLTGVNFISSSFLGCLNNMLVQASSLKKHITIRVGQDVSWLFAIMGSRKNMDMEIY